jgi:hypothetical protein
MITRRQLRELVKRIEETEGLGLDWQQHVDALVAQVLALPRREREPTEREESE